MLEITSWPATEVINLLFVKDLLHVARFRTGAATGCGWGVVADVLRTRWKSCGTFRLEKVEWARLAVVIVPERLRWSVLAQRIIIGNTPDSSLTIRVLTRSGSHHSTLEM